MGCSARCWSARCCWCWGVELLNSAVEAVIERYGPEFHELAGRAKDMGSAAVLMMMLNVLACWGLILGPRLYLFLFSPSL